MRVLFPYFMHLKTQNNFSEHIDNVEDDRECCYVLMIKMKTTVKMMPLESAKGKKMKKDISCKKLTNWSNELNDSTSEIFSSYVFNLLTILLYWKGNNKIIVMMLFSRTKDWYEMKKSQKTACNMKLDNDKEKWLSRPFYSQLSDWVPQRSTVP